MKIFCFLYIIIIIDLYYILISNSRAASGMKLARNFPSVWGSRGYKIQ